VGAGCFSFFLNELGNSISYEFVVFHFRATDLAISTCSVFFSDFYLWGERLECLWRLRRFGHLELFEFFADEVLYFFGH